MEPTVGSETAETAVRRRPLVLWAVLAVLGLVAGTLAVVAARDGSGTGPPLPLALGAGGAQALTEMAADSSMLPYGPVTYVPGDGLPALGGRGDAYRLVADLDAADVERFAAALGLDGDVEAWELGWRVSGDGGELEVLRPGSGGFWFARAGSSGGVAEPAVGHEVCTVEELEDGSTTESCTLTVPAPADDVVDGPVDVGDAVPATTVPVCVADGTCETFDCVGDDCGLDPIPPAPRLHPGPTVVEISPEPPLPADDAERVARDLHAAVGVGLDVVAASAEEAFGSHRLVTLQLGIDGTPVEGATWYVEVAPDGEVRSAGGLLGDAERLGAYDLLDTTAAIDRLNAEMGGWMSATPLPAGATDAVATFEDVGDPIATWHVDVGGEVEVHQVPADPTTSAVDPCDPVDGLGAACVPVSTTMGPSDVPGAAPRCLPPEAPDAPDAGTDAAGPDDAVSSTPAAAPCGPADEILPVEPVDEPLPVAPDPAPGGEPVVPEPQEVDVTGAEHILLVHHGWDGEEAFVVPGYRFTAADGSEPQVVAVDDDGIAPAPDSTTVETAVPEPAPFPDEAPAPGTEPGSAPGAGPTTTIVEPAGKEEVPGTGEQGLEVGSSHYVDVDLECRAFALGGSLWVLDEGSVEGWQPPGERHEGGTFTLDAEDRGTFVGDAAGEKVATFRLVGPTEDPVCPPQPR